MPSGPSPSPAGAPAQGSRARVRRPIDGPTAARWVLLVAWITLPGLVGAVLDTELSRQDPALATLVSIACWAGWAAGTVSLLVPRTSSLTVLRVLAPAALVVPLLATVAPTQHVGDVVGPRTEVGGFVLALALAQGALVTGLALTAWVGHVFVNGSSYGDERRYLLRPSPSLLLGPLPLAWCAMVGLPGFALVLLGNGPQPVGFALAVISVPVVVVVARALHGLTRRWLVFVPAGIVVHDYSVLVDSVLVQKRIVAGIAPAADPPVAAIGDEPPTDLTGRALGLVVQLDFTEPVTITPRPRQRPGTGAVATSVDVTAVLVAPSRAGALLGTLPPERRR